MAFEADKKDNYWRLINFIPVLASLIMLFNFCLFIKTESIMYSIRNNNTDDALIMIDKIYHRDENRLSILKTLQSQCHKKKELQVPYWESLFGDKYCKGTVTLMLYSAFFQWSGVVLITMLSNRILTIMNENVEPPH